jgi:hypothetical protein
MQKVYVHDTPATNKVYLPWEKDEKEEDKTWFEHREMTEADYQKFANLTSTIKLGGKNKGKEDDRAEVDMMVGTTRSFLMENLVIGWNLVGEDGKPIARTPNNIKRLPPHIVKVVVDDIYDKNPILKPEEEDEGNKELDNSAPPLE